jgi:hypothetical protein
MATLIQIQDFEWQSFSYGRGKLRDYRLRHLPTGMQWDSPGDPSQTVWERKRQLFAAANRGLIALGRQPDEDWVRRIAELNEP